MRNSLNLLLAAVVGTALSLATFSSCGDGKKTDADETPKYLWMCAEANFQRFASKDSINYYLDKAKETGFNHIYLDVKPIPGQVLFKSSIVPMLTSVDTVVIERDWDYLQYFIDAAHERDIKVIAAACAFPAGSPWWHRGLVYDDTTFQSRVCLEQMPDNSLKPIYEDRKQVAAFLNPARQDNRDFAMSVLVELMRNYDIDGLALDYCRFPDSKSDFSPETRAAFQEYLGETIENWPGDVFTYNEDGTEHVAGKYYKQWWAWRAGLITDFIHQVSDSLKAIRPDAKLDYWAASWIHAISGNGQNWASPKSDWVWAYPAYASKEYKEAGFAPYLDNFIVGTYLERVYGADDNESIEYGLHRADTLLHGDCNLVGSIYAVNHSTDTDDPHNIYNAVTCCLDMTGSVMVFDIIQVIQYDQWDEIKRAFDDYDARNKK